MKQVFRQMRVLFLDFDGVLHAVNGKAFVHVEALAAVLSGHEDVKIVITSSHRRFCRDKPVGPNSSCSDASIKMRVSRTGSLQTSLGL